MENNASKQIDIKNYPEIVKIINDALNTGNVIEVKNESRTEKPNIVVVEIKRKMLTHRA